MNRKWVIATVIVAFVGATSLQIYENGKVTEDKERVKDAEQEVTQYRGYTKGTFIELHTLVKGNATAEKAVSDLEAEYKKADSDPNANFDSIQKVVGKISRARPQIEGGFYGLQFIQVSSRFERLRSQVTEHSWALFRKHRYQEHPSGIKGYLERTFG